MAVARSASREHPSRILGVVFGDQRGAPRVDAQVGIGSGLSGERAQIRLSGEVTKHPASVVLPLLLPDSPVVGLVARQRARRPGERPARPARHPPDHRRRVGAHQQGEGDAHPVPQLRAGQHRPRLDPDHRLAGPARRGPRPAPRHRCCPRRSPPSGSAPARTCSCAWLGDRLKCDVTRKNSEGPGITGVVLSTKQGDVTHHPLRRPARDAVVAQPAGPAGRAEAPRPRRAALRGAAPPRPRRRVRRDREADGQDRSGLRRNPRRSPPRRPQPRPPRRADMIEAGDRDLPLPRGPGGRGGRTAGRPARGRPGRRPHPRRRR